MIRPLSAVGPSEWCGDRIGASVLTATEAQLFLPPGWVRIVKKQRWAGPFE